MHAPVPTVTCVRMILAITASARRHLTQLDVKTRFLNAPIDIQLDVILPEDLGMERMTNDFAILKDAGAGPLPQSPDAHRARVFGVTRSLLS